MNGLPIVRKLSNVFPEDLLGVTHERYVEFQIDLVMGGTLIAKASYCLAHLEMQELSTQL